MWCTFVCSEDEGRELCRKRGCEFKLPYPIIDINGCDSPPNGDHLAVTSSTGGDQLTSQHHHQHQQQLIRPVATAAAAAAAAVKKPPSASRNVRKRKKDNRNSLSSLYSPSAGAELKNCSELLQQYPSTGMVDACRGNGYQDVMMGCSEYGRIQPMIMGCRRDYDDEDVMKMKNDATDCRCYYGNGITSSAGGGAGAWSYWAQENTQLASYLYDQQQRYLADYSQMYGRLVTSPPPSLSNGYEALPMATTGSLYEALTPPDDDDSCLRALAATTTTTTTTTFPPPQRPQRADDGDQMIGSSYRLNDNTADRFVVSSNNNNNNNNTPPVAEVTDGVSAVGQGGYGVATPVIQMTTKSRCALTTFCHLRDTFSSPSVP